MLFFKYSTKIIAVIVTTESSNIMNRKLCRVKQKYGLIHPDIMNKFCYSFAKLLPKYCTEIVFAYMKMFGKI